MEEFVENFATFREWLYDLGAANPEEAALLKKIRNKFNTLGLNDVF